MNAEKITIRKAYEHDCEEMLNLIKELAVYEKAGDQVELTVEQLKNDGFGSQPLYESFVALNHDELIGMALYYYKYSTWKGRCLFLEDLVVKEQHRKLGIGSLLFQQVINKSKEEGVKRMEWQVLDWNDPAIEFYNKYQAELDPEWLNGRFYEADIQKLGH